MGLLQMKVPSPGESISEVEIAAWLVSDGDYVVKDQAIAEVDSDKATLELPAEESGVISFKAEEGDVVKVGQVVCTIDTNAEKPEGTPEITKKSTPEPNISNESSVEQVQNKETYATGHPSPAAAKIMKEKQQTNQRVLAHIL